MKMRLICGLLCLCLLCSGCGQKTEEVAPPPMEVVQETVQPPVVELPPEEEPPQPPVVQEELSPVPQEPEPVPPAQPRCVLSISCTQALQHSELQPSVREVLPEDGWLLPATPVDFAEGESVFDILLRTTRQQSIHMEFVDTAVYGTAYIEGIGGLYEFACGGYSGWVYTVNGESPTVGCSSFYPQDGDVIVWDYFCQ